jgi:hypothetical protein
MRSKVEKEIKRITKALYGEEIKFKNIHRFVIFGQKNSKLLTFIAIRKAVTLERPLMESDVESAHEELLLSLKWGKNKEKFLEIIRINELLSQLLWLRATLAILRRKAAHQADNYSYLGGLYALERVRLGPISDLEKLALREITGEIESVTKTLEVADLEVIKSCDRGAHDRYVRELEEWKSKTIFDSQEEQEEELEILEVIRCNEEKLVGFISGMDINFYES